MTTPDISNSADIIDSRDIIARIEELEADEESLDEAQKERDECSDEDTNEALEIAKDDFDDDAKDELKALRDLAEEASGSPDWEHGEQLIDDCYFEEYARELAEDIGAVESNQSWPNNFIDWEAAADALKQDYMSVDYDGREYWIRA